MLFSTLYNWLKYKSLPSSLLFLNRLFVERDSKHRRTTSNLGLTFRSSKWSAYARSNINTSTRKSYANWAFYTMTGYVSVFLTISYFSYCAWSVFPTTIPLIWLVWDSDTYWKALLTSSLICVAQAGLVSTRSALTSRWFGVDAYVEPVATLQQGLVIPSRLHKPLIYSWSSSSTLNSANSELFDFGQPTKPYKSLYKSLYSYVKSLARVHNIHGLPVCNESTSDPVLLKRVTMGSLGRPHSWAALEQSATSGFPQASFPTTLYTPLVDCVAFGHTAKPAACGTTLLHTWSLGSLHTETVQLGHDLTTPTGPFYLAGLPYSDLSKLSHLSTELAPLCDSLNSQASLVRWYRWLYKYNTLHRSSTAASLYINATLKLTGSGFYDSSLTSRNIWSASFKTTGSHKSKQPLGKQPLCALYESLYGDYVNSSAQQSASLSHSAAFYNSPDMTLLATYPQSYHWYVQRFYQINALKATHSATLPNVNVPVLTTAVRGVSNLGLSDLLLGSQSQDSLTAGYHTLEPRSGSLEFFRKSSTSGDLDVYLDYSDQTFLSKERCESLMNTLGPRSGGDIIVYRSVDIEPYVATTFEVNLG